jgi:hypothetical protein
VLWPSPCMDLASQYQRKSPRRQTAPNRFQQAAIPDAARVVS